MPSTLSVLRREATFTDPDRLLPTIEFAIDGVSLHGMLLEKNAPLLTPRSSLPDFVGFPNSYTHLLEALKDGHSTSRNLPPGLVPLLICVCGLPSCGGVWTRVTVGENHVNWAGFGFWNESGPFAPDYLDQLFVFEREPYERLFRSLIEESRSAG